MVGGNTHVETSHRPVIDDLGLDTVQLRDNPDIGSIPGAMTIAPDYHQLHETVDRLAPAQAEALYVVAKTMLGEPVPITFEPESTPTAPYDSPQDWSFEPDAAAVRDLSIAGIAHGSPDLARNAKDILRRELGGHHA